MISKEMIRRKLASMTTEQVKDVAEALGVKVDTDAITKAWLELSS